MLDLNKVPVIDNHSHPFDLEKVTLDADSLAKVFFHGIGRYPQRGGQESRDSGELRMNSGITCVIWESSKQWFACYPSYWAVRLSWRLWLPNATGELSENFPAYARFAL